MNFSTVIMIKTNNLLHIYTLSNMIMEFGYLRIMSRSGVCWGEGLSPSPPPQYMQRGEQKYFALSKAHQGPKEPGLVLRTEMDRIILISHFPLRPTRSILGPMRRRGVHFSLRSISCDITMHDMARGRGDAPPPSQLKQHTASFYRP